MHYLSYEHTNSFTVYCTLLFFSLFPIAANELEVLPIALLLLHWKRWIVSRFWLCFPIDILSTVLIPFMFVYLHCFDCFLKIPPSLMPWLVDYVQCLHAIGQTTIQSPAASMKSIKTMPKPRHFSQFRNPIQDMSRKKMSGHSVLSLCQWHMGL